MSNTKKHTKIIVAITIIIACILCIVAVIGAFHLGYILGNSLAVRKQIQEEVDRVEKFFKKDGYEIDGYLADLSNEAKNRCYISEHFVFYYGRNDKEIIKTIKDFCEIYSDTDIADMRKLVCRRIIDI